MPFASTAVISVSIPKVVATDVKIIHALALARFARHSLALSYEVESHEF